MGFSCRSFVVKLIRSKEEETDEDRALIVQTLVNDLVETIADLESQPPNEDEDVSLNEDQYDQEDRLIDFVSADLKSSTRINFNDSLSTSTNSNMQADSNLNLLVSSATARSVSATLASAATTSMDEPSVLNSIGSESTASTVVVVVANNQNNKSAEAPTIVNQSDLIRKWSLRLRRPNLSNLLSWLVF